MTDDTPKQVWRKSDIGLVPASTRAHEVYNKLKFGQLIQTDIKRPRNVDHHRKYWAMMQWASENLEGNWTPEQVHHIVKVRTGHCDFKEVNGEVVAIPKETNFGAMDQTKFDNYYKAATQAVLDMLPYDADQETINQAVGWV